MIAPRPLRPYQVHAIELLRQSLREGHRRPVIQLSCGAGKTRIAAEIFLSALGKGKKGIFVVPRLVLVAQTIRSFEREGITDIGLIQGNHPRRNPDAQVQICSAQTLGRRGVQRSDLVIVDECFAGETMVLTPDGQKRIDAFHVGDKVLNATGCGAVEHVFQKQSHTIELELSNGQSIRVTGDHPFFTDRGWVKAEALERRSFLFGQEALLALWRDFQADVLSRGSEVEESGVLLDILLEEACKPDVGSSYAREAKRDSSQDQASADSTRWKREALAASAISALACFGGGLDGGSSGPDRSAHGRNLSVLLQGGHREQGHDDRDRGGRRVSRWGEKDTGREEGRFPDFIRVENISRVERESAEPVFNLHVSGHPSYFAGGVLVHNCHLGFKKINKWIASPDWARVPFIGLSATPWARGMSEIWDDLIKPVSIQELIAGGYLSPFRVYVEAAPDLTGVRTVAGDFKEDDLSTATNTVALNANVVSTWLEKGEDRPTIVYAVDRAHSRALTDRFVAARVAAQHIDCETPQEEREAIFARYTSGETRVICNVATLDTGLDLDVRCICDCRPTKSRMRFVQAVGRGLRIADGKDDLVVLDHAGNHTRLGAVTKINVRNLLKGEECLSDQLVKEPDDPEAISCLGGPKNVFEREGKLIELDLVAAHTVAPSGEREIFHAMLSHYARSRGYKAGWVTVNFFERYGRYPGASIRRLTPTPPDAVTMRWIQSRLREYALKAGGASYG